MCLLKSPNLVLELLLKISAAPQSRLPTDWGAPIASNSLRFDLSNRTDMNGGLGLVGVRKDCLVPVSKGGSTNPTNFTCIVHGLGLYVFFTDCDLPW